jgi:hypothetical protein
MQVRLEVFGAQLHHQPFQRTSIPPAAMENCSDSGFSNSSQLRGEGLRHIAAMRNTDQPERFLLYKKVLSMRKRNFWFRKNIISMRAGGPWQAVG